MVEVALAIGILAVGTATVVTLMPVGMKQTQDSIGQNYSALFTDDTYSYLSSLAKQNSTSMPQWNSFVATLPVYSDLFIGNPATPPIIITTNGLTKIQGTDLFATGNNGVYAIAKSTASRPGNEQDYAAQVLIWQSPTGVAGTTGIGINVEISWPLHQADYSKRSKLVYYFEVYKVD